MKEKYHKIKEFLANPKKKSLTLIIIYAIFFGFVFLYINSSKSIDSNITINNNNNNNNINISSYEYIYEFNETKITGTYYNSKLVFYIDNTKYDIDESVNIKELNIDYPIIELSYNNIKKFLDNITYESKTEYKDGNTKYEYILNNQEFNDYFRLNIKDELVNIIVYEKDYINEIEINSSYKINVYYNNINNITNIETNKEY